MSYDRRMSREQFNQEVKKLEMKKIEEAQNILAKKFDGGKPEMSLLPASALIEVAKVLSFGKQKYGANNWRNGMEWTRLSSAMLRHLFAWLDGENLDPETGINHLAHASCCALFLIEYQNKQLGTDDRYGDE